ncbi:MAG: hypothetical protein AAFA34_02200 [Thermoplasmata archaeon]|jgi:phenylalanyl-tRNA synthetase beta chain
MPQEHLSLARLERLLGVPVDEAQLTTLLFSTKAEIEGIRGDDLTLSVTPDRLDLLSESGLALALAGVLDRARGPAPWTPRPRPEPFGIEIDGSVAPLRPALAAIRVEAPPGHPLDTDLLSEAIRFQETLHATVGRDRRAASLGIYPLSGLRPPLRYAAEPIDTTRFVPLGETTERPARVFFAEHPLAERYGAFGRIGDRILTLRDSEGRLLSLPPVLNSGQYGEARPGDSALLLESTGTKERTTREILGLLQVVFAGRGWSWSPVTLRSTAGASAPSAAGRPASRIRLTSRGLAERTGYDLSPSEVESWLGRARLGAVPGPDGWEVEVPPWRPDLLGEVDLAEEVLVARGLTADEGLVLPSRTRGGRLEEIRFRRHWAPLLLGLGAVPLYNTVLISADTVEALGDPRALRIHHPVSREYAYARPSLLHSMAATLRRNTRHGYPQLWSEIGPVLQPPGSAAPAGATRYHAALVWAGEGHGFSDVASVAECLLDAQDVSSVREPMDHPSAIPGRSARVRVAGVDVAELGELHPRVLEALGLPVPVAWFEADLSALWPLVRPSGTH